jgi:hypothetical protein
MDASKGISTLKEDLPAAVRTLIQSQTDIAKLAHDEVRALEKAHTR